jgi:hypothetical protein
MEPRRERRDFFRVEGQVLLEYRKMESDEPGRFPPWFRVPVSVHGHDPISPHGTATVLGDEGPRGRILEGLVQRLQRIEEKLDALLAAETRPFQTEGECLEPCLVNISGSGMRFPTRERFRVGDRLEVTVILPITPHHPVRLAGEVVHVLDTGHDGDQGPGARPFDTAVRFVSLSDPDRERIVRFTMAQQYEAVRSLQSPDSASL